MDSAPFPENPASDGPAAAEITDTTVATLVGEVFDAAPATDRRRLLEYLLPPMGVLALVAVANGIFARIRFRNDWAQFHVRLEDAGQVQGSDVAALVERLQQISTDAVNGLAQIVSTSPVMASSTAAAVLVTLLLQRARAQRANEAGERPPRLPTT